MIGIFVVGLVGILAALLATFIRKERGDLALLIGIVAGAIIFFYIISQVSAVIGFVTNLLKMVEIEKVYYTQLLKMLGVAYVAEFAASICKDAGYQSIAGMIELFAKISIVALSIPGLTYLVKTLESFI